ncbi:outer membrane protein assembly factor BamB family protein [Cellulomonas edaphi]|uniref:PQQ-binding-like beta-propeller repeat protein n=1 Tax=Cellulomonas edaphi TaxID=3053468 RepID=A0ABT7S4D8_9CELL|nr:PQQ-binding-like beta-propeller repeat protein [Cellulomons edaphi]MDM7830489.1 PQQ-binding-like beta-propeller repeat protein [Cellulomons edaphi]
MARGHEMQHVLLEDAPAEAARSPKRRRASWWVGGTVGAVVLALVAGQWVVDRREGAAVARLLSLPGVVGPLGAELVASPTMQAVLGPLLGGGRPAVLDADGAQTLTWSAGSPGGSWTATVMGPTPALAAADAQATSWCQPDTAPPEGASTARFVVCAVSDGGWVQAPDDPVMSSEVPARRSDVLVLDAADGTAVARWAVPHQASVAVLGDLVAVGALPPDGGPGAVTAYDIETGAQRWSYRPSTAPPRGDSGWGGVSVGRAAGLLAVQASETEVTFLRPDGTEVRRFAGGDQASAYVSCGEQPSVGVVCTTSGTDGGSSVILLGDDAAPARDRQLTGGLVPMTVDDGSVPGLVLTQDDTIRAWDEATGRPRWSLEGGSQVFRSEAVVLRGVVYTVVDGALMAVDGRTGDVRWSSDAKPDQQATGVLTDGRRVVATYESGGEPGSHFLVAFDPSSGERLFRAAYPAHVDRLMVAGKNLVGFDDTSNDYYLVR